MESSTGTIIFTALMAGISFTTGTYLLHLATQHLDNFRLRMFSYMFVISAYSYLSFIPFPMSVILAPAMFIFSIFKERALVVALIAAFVFSGVLAVLLYENTPHPETTQADALQMMGIDNMEAAIQNSVHK